ncbi:hypothetical protein WT56_24250 [Burkholderia pseudomultivorans]|uniref:Uncharacterized protein n=1 Tax=Burkholderia pseudomultivorans TaxID=1207504 RepID=A0A132ECL0_9BURK|nr:hypothetical protein WT56_24250 [Burkholderia pseudomultivorans]
MHVPEPAQVVTHTQFVTRCRFDPHLAALVAGPVSHDDGPQHANKALRRVERDPATCTNGLDPRRGTTIENRYLFGIEFDDCVIDFARKQRCEQMLDRTHTDTVGIAQHRAQRLRTAQRWTGLEYTKFAPVPDPSEHDSVATTRLRDRQHAHLHAPSRMQAMPR